MIKKTIEDIYDLAGTGIDNTRINILVLQWFRDGDLSYQVMMDYLDITQRGEVFYDLLDDELAMRAALRDDGRF